ncbi:hypothetical protein HK100_001647 [Physocladia obscura]|uniref:Fungal lipase-type domain-containing protein n=1 Tax=Physocladia obscura TaxID=109957 RepID=A0AAD5SZI4_9FUNG|nr:hypothetical protein HK100_001647 [Physocladia obscura]
MQSPQRLSGLGLGLGGTGRRESDAERAARERESEAARLVARRAQLEQAVFARTPTSTADVAVVSGGGGVIGGCLVCDAPRWQPLVPSDAELATAPPSTTTLTNQTSTTTTTTTTTTRFQKSATQHAATGPEDLDFDRVLEATHVFLSLLNSFVPSCSRCSSLPLVALVGTSGAGKSTLLNLLAGHVPTFVDAPSGARVLVFPQQQSTITTLTAPVSASATSATRVPLFCVTRTQILVDFPGFFDTRAGALEFIQSAIMPRILTRRNAKVVLVKSAVLDRDAHFAHFLAAGLMVPRSCLVVLTKATPRTVLDWTQYIDDSDPLKQTLVAKFKSAGLKCVRINQPEYHQHESPRAFASAAITTISDALAHITPTVPAATIPASPTVLKFAHDSAQKLKIRIAHVLSTQLQVSLQTYQFQPYNAAILRTLLCSVFATPEPIVNALKMLGLVGTNDNDGDGTDGGLEDVAKLVDFWNIFHEAGLLSGESLTAGNFIHPPQMAKISQASQTLDMKIDISPDMPLHAKLLKWTAVRESFHLEYISYKAQLQILLRRARTESYGVSLAECKRLIMYRLERCGYMEEAWCSVARDLQQVMDRPKFMAGDQKNDDGSAAIMAGDMKDGAFGAGGAMSAKDWDFEFLAKLMNEDALRELLKLGLESRGSIGNVIVLIGGAGVSGAAAMVETVAGIISSHTGVAIEIGASGTATMVAGALFAALTVGAVASYIYIRQQRQKQLNEGGVLGLDFSEYGLEKEVWKSGMDLVESITQNDQGFFYTVLFKLESLFKIYEEKFSWDLIQKRRLIDLRFAEMQNIPQDANDTQNVIRSWINVVSANQKLMHTIVSKLKGRSKNVSGCSYYEHSLVEEFRFFPITASCCRYLSGGNAKRCIHCDNYFHDSQANKQCLIEARSILCKDRLSNPTAATKPSSVQVYFFDEKTFPPLDWNTLPNAHKRTAARLSSAIYSQTELRTQFRIPPSAVTTVPADNIAYLVTAVDGVAFVVFRGTEPASSQNWLTNATFALADYEDCALHAGYLRICQQQINAVWQAVLDLGCNTVVFAGHSLGGALAHAMHLLCLLQKFETTALPVLSIGFGAPPPFGKKTQAFFAAHRLEGRFVTLANQCDPVPMVFRMADFLQTAIEEAATPGGTGGAGGGTSAGGGGAGGAVAAATTALISQEFKTALNFAAFLPRVMAAQYGYAGTYVFFDGNNSSHDVLGRGEQAVLWTHDSVTKWMGLTKMEQCSVRCHIMSLYLKFVEQQYI